MKAIQYFKRSLQLNRDYLPAWTLMGHEFVELKNSHAAIEAYRRAVGEYDLSLSRVQPCSFPHPRRESKGLSSLVWSGPGLRITGHALLRHSVLQPSHRFEVRLCLYLALGWSKPLIDLNVDHMIVGCGRPWRQSTNT